MKKTSLELVQWLMKKMETAQSQMDYDKDALKREEERAKEEERDVDDYYAQQVSAAEKEYNMLENVFELI